jgi:3-oxoacyl-[acyl-carrier protein] reductase
LQDYRIGDEHMLTLKGRTAIVTGGSRGIGLAIAQAFAKDGMNVGILSVRAESAKTAAQHLADSGYPCKGVACDVSDVESVHSALKTVVSRFGGIDVVVNCAGILDVSSIPDMSPQHWDEIMAVNLKGTFLVVQQAMPYLQKSRAPRVVNISSNAGRMGGYENGLAYTASKGGIIALTYGLARRLAPMGITVNCIAPGPIASDMSQAYDEAARTRLLTRIPLGRLGTPAEVAAAACYFASEESGFTTGAVLDVNGGMFMG